MTKARELSDYTGLQGDLAAKSPVASPVFTGNVSHGDNVKAKFGTGNDLEIFHDGSHSRIKDVGTGHLVLSGGEVHFNNSDNTSNHLVINADGIVTKPLQPAFCASASTQNNMGLNSWNHILFANERFDQNQDYAANTFTAPVTGKYQLQVSVRLDNIDTSTQYYQVRIATSNRAYHTICDFDGMSTDPSYWNFNISVLVDMDASDTCQIQFIQASGSQQTDINDESYFSGYLVC